MPSLTHIVGVGVSTGKVLLDNSAVDVIVDVLRVLEEGVGVLGEGEGVLGEGEGVLGEGEGEGVLGEGEGVLKGGERVLEEGDGVLLKSGVVWDVDCVELKEVVGAVVDARNNQ